MHLRCYSLWDSARQEKEQAQTPICSLPAGEDHGTIAGRERDPRAERGSE
jgi:hypothetical protein